MTEKIQSLFELFDEPAEIMAWLVFLNALTSFYVADLDDYVYGALIGLSCALMGYIRNVKFGTISWENIDDSAN